MTKVPNCSPPCFITLKIYLTFICYLLLLVLVGVLVLILLLLLLLLRLREDRKLPHYLKTVLVFILFFFLRCGIPVVIMGETGCGKTCLIRYMCGLQSGRRGPKNLLLMKVT